MSRAPMSTSRAQESVSRLLEILVTSADAEVRDRVLLEAALASGAGSCAALWRPYRVGPTAEPPLGQPAAWMPLLAIGQVAGLPDDTLVRGVLEGGLDPEIRSDVRVLAGGARGRRVALVLGGVRSEPAVEQVEALLFAFALLDDAGLPRDPAAAFLASVPSPLPADEESGEIRRLGHDLRNLLAGAMATKQLLDEFGHELSHDQFEDTDRVFDRECRRLGSLFSAALGGGTAAGACALERALETVADVALAQAEFARTLGVRVDVRVEAPGGRGALALPEEALGRLAVNLLANAREAVLRSPRGPRAVSLQAFESRGAPGLVLVVEDDGPGLPEGPLDRLFVEGFSHGKPAGSGLGLAVVAQLVGGCGGCLRARNRPLGGARFEVWIPAA